MSKKILQQFVILVDFLGKALGPDYEIALHDISNPTNSIIAIANGHISGRSIGSPLTNIALQLISDKNFEHEDYQLHYSGLSSNNRRLRSSTMYIKDENNNLIGLLCINFDDSRYQDVSERVMRLCHPDFFVRTSFAYDTEKLQNGSSSNKKNSVVERFYSSISDFIDEMIDQILSYMGTTSERLTTDEKISIVETLYNNNVFYMKGAVIYVAEKLNCSQATIYRYIKNIKNKSSDPS
ncbi:MAG: transcriptional regulator [Clostridiaceae bacterium]|nr:transcriptional regulator [Clostridiaceae bacterium]